MDTGFEQIDSSVKHDLIFDIVDKKNGQLDLDWIELCEKYDLDLNPDTLRKAGVGVKLVADAGMLSRSSSTLMDEEYMARQKMRDLYGKIRTLERERSRSDLLRETIHAAIENLDPIESPSVFRITRRDDNERALVVGLGDLHYGANINVVGLYGETINSYDHHVFERRMWDLLNEIKNIIAKENIEVVYVMLVGDLIDGMLRQSQLMKLEFGVVESTIRLSEFLAKWFVELSRYAKVDVSGCFGNHSEIRPLGSKKGEFAEENMEKVIYWYLKERLADVDDVSIMDDCGKYRVVDVCGFQFMLFHGDDVRNAASVARDSVNIYGKRIDYFVCGHLHKETEIPAGMTPTGDATVIRVPSICGTDTYAHSKGYGGAPGATAIVIERGYGRRCIYPIKLQ